MSEDALENSLNRAQTAYRLLREIRPLLTAKGTHTPKTHRVLAARVDKLLTVVEEKNGR